VRSDGQLHLLLHGMRRIKPERLQLAQKALHLTDTPVERSIGSSKLEDLSPELGFGCHGSSFFLPTAREL